ncbi:UNVERIFIED_CONTAM: hypothetical protein Sangu_0478100 [Sesamum angustifolium]|uniref:Uncharacterized protein n=1 Tax=Sesamum angustifolium TaxID=2727405 RepID=A0AAW2Q8I9_9LAMI
MATPSDVGVSEEGDQAPPAPAPLTMEGPDALVQPQAGEVLPKWLVRLECLQKVLQDVQY